MSVLCDNVVGEHVLLQLFPGRVFPDLSILDVEPNLAYAALNA